jgi:hypothetical protein
VNTLCRILGNTLSFLVECGCNGERVDGVHMPVSRDVDGSVYYNDLVSEVIEMGLLDAETALEREPIHDPQYVRCSREVSRRDSNFSSTSRSRDHGHGIEYSRAQNLATFKVL